MDACDHRTNVLAPYQYSALDEDASEIRLMTLLPGKFQDDVFITLETVTLTRHYVPHYEALSYVWGSPEHPRKIFNMFQKCFSPPNLDYSSFERTRSYMSHILETTYESPLQYSGDISNWYGVANTILVGRCLFTTNDGYIGLTPKATKPDDQVCILLRCQTPLILRPTGAWGHEVVGECYLDGFMEGAAYLGTLPDEWQMVCRDFQESSGQFSGQFVSFLDESGGLQIEDPRLGPLPAGWSVGSNEEERAQNLYVNDETKEKTWEDRRINPEALAARGVDLKELEVI